MIRYAAECRSELSCGDATGITLMTETVAPVAKPVPRPRKPATVSGSALAQHLDCSRTYIGRLEAEGVIQRQGSGFPLDQSRVAYIRYLRRERRQSPRSAADAAYAKAKTELLQIRITEKHRELVRQSDVDELIDQIAGVTLTALSSPPARCAPRGDLAIRRSIERVVFEVRTEIAKVCQEMADKNGEPPLSEQGLTKASDMKSAACVHRCLGPVLKVRRGTACLRLHGPKLSSSGPV